MPSRRETLKLVLEVAGLAVSGCSNIQVPYFGRELSSNVQTAPANSPNRYRPIVPDSRFTIVRGDIRERYYVPQTNITTQGELVSIRATTDNGIYKGEKDGLVSGPRLGLDFLSVNDLVKYFLEPYKTTVTTKPLEPLLYSQGSYPRSEFGGVVKVISLQGDQYNPRLSTATYLIEPGDNAQLTFERIPGDDGWKVGVKGPYLSNGEAVNLVDDLELELRANNSISQPIAVIAELMNLQIKAQP